MEVTSRLKGSDLVDRVPGERWTEVRNTVKEAVRGNDQNHPREKEMQEGKVGV